MFKHMCIFASVKASKAHDESLLKCERLKLSSTTSMKQTYTQKNTLKKHNVNDVSALRCLWCVSGSPATYASNTIETAINVSLR